MAFDAANIDNVFIERLSFIKYLYLMGTKQCSLNEPLCTTAILAFQDGIELFLNLCFDKLDITQPKAKITFDEYFKFIDEELKKRGAALTRVNAMKNLNKARVGLKHHGNRPSRTDLLNYKDQVAAFFSENCPVIFELDFEEVSIIDMIASSGVRNRLWQSKDDYEKGHFAGALKNIRTSFDIILKREKELHDRFSLGARDYYRLEDIRLDRLRFNCDGEVEIRRVLKGIIKAISHLGEQSTLLELGVKSIEYLEFKKIISHVTIFENGRCKVAEGYSLTKDDFDYCITFIVNLSLTLEEMITGCPSYMRNVVSYS